MFYGRSILIIKQIKLLKVARPTGVFQATLKIAVVLHSGNINGLTIFMFFLLQLHQPLMIITLILTSVAFIIIFVEAEGYSEVCWFVDILLL